MKRVKDILSIKGRDIWSIGPDQTVYDAIYLLAEKQIGALVVIEEERLVGVLSERDYTRQIILKGRSSEKTRVREIMSKNVVTTEPCQSIRECMQLMTDKKIRHLPVVDEGNLIGIVSIGDLVLEVIAEQESTIGELEKYISG